MKMKRILVVIIAVAAMLPALAFAGAEEELMAEYKAGGAGAFSAKKGGEMWTAISSSAKSGKPSACAACHGTDLRQNGKHAVTGETIEPMAPSVNPKRLTDKKFVEKWFKRNCKEVFSRECSAGEKGDFLAFIAGK